MIGAIAGDIIGSIYECHPIKTTEFPLFRADSCFTDDTVLSIAIADAVLNGTAYADSLRAYYRRYPTAGYGGSFEHWAESDSLAPPYNSWGNGSAMRVSPIAYAARNLEQALAEAKASAEVTHNHPEGIKGAQATAAAIFLLRQGETRKAVKSYLETQFGYDLSSSIAQLRPHYEFDVSCQGTVPAAFIAFLDAEDYENTVRLAVSLGGDSDTLACIAGSFAEAYYGSVPAEIVAQALQRLPSDLGKIVQQFAQQFQLHYVN